MRKVNIKKGGRYQCFNVECGAFGGKCKIIGFTVGKIYVSHADEHLRNDDKLVMTFFHDAGKFFYPIYVMQNNK